MQTRQVEPTRNTLGGRPREQVRVVKSADAVFSALGQMQTKPE